MTRPALILASASPYRRELLQRLQLPFETVSPNVDEASKPGESAQDLSLRLARDKALAIASQRPDALVIGSDQVLCVGDELLGKPGNHANAVKQLQKLSGRAMTFFTALCVAGQGGNDLQQDVITTRVQFRKIDLAEIEAYLAAEPAYDCAGSCKAEGLGITLCEAIDSSDPTALIGLPLISLRRMLYQAGLRLPA